MQPDTMMPEPFLGVSDPIAHRPTGVRRLKAIIALTVLIVGLVVTALAIGGVLWSVLSYQDHADAPRDVQIVDAT